MLPSEMLTVLACRDIDSIKRYLIRGGDADMRLGSGENEQRLLHHAAMSGEVEIIKLLLSYDADMNALNGTQRTPRFLALINGHVEAADFFESIGAKFSDLPDETPLLTSLFYRQEDMALHLLDQEADPFQANREKMTPLHYAASYGQHRAAERLLSLRVNINAKNAQGSTPLICAVAQKLPNMALHLLDRGADPNGANSVGNSALSLAVSGGLVPVVRRLIECGVEDNLWDTKSGRKALSAMVHVAGYLEIYHLLNDAPKIRAAYLEKITAEREACYAAIREVTRRPLTVRKPLTFKGHKPAR